VAVLSGFGVQFAVPAAAFTGIVLKFCEYEPVKLT